MKSIVNAWQTRRRGQRLCYACKALGYAFGVMMAVQNAGAGVIFDRSARLLCVSDYPESNPCRPETLLRVDRLNNWNIVSYNASVDEYHLDANLQVGLANGTPTFFQLGSAEHPRETLVVRGHVMVYPSRIAGEKHQTGSLCVNRLTLGSPAVPEIAAVLKIESAPGQKYGLYVKELPPSLYGGKRFSPHIAQGGQLHVYNSRITAVAEDNAQAFAGGFLYGESIIFSNAVMDWFAGVATYGLLRANATVEKTVFAHGGSAMINYGWVARRCVFRNLKTAVRDWGGALRAELHDCVFESNRQNLRLTIAGSMVIAVDCEFGQAELPDLICNERQTKEGNALPVLISHRHVRVMVADESGAPISCAKVICRSLTDDDDLNTVTRWEGLADQDGLTPGRGATNAVLLAEYRVRAAKSPDGHPECMNFEYEILVEADGFAPAVVKPFRPNSSWLTVPVKLIKKRDNAAL